MPLEQPWRDNPLMSRHFDATGLTGKALARRAEVSHSQVYMARFRHVGARNAAKIARAVSNVLGLSFYEELELKAEIMGFPGNMLRAYLGNGLEAAEALCEEEHVCHALIAGEPLSEKAGARVVEKLEARGAPEGVIASVRSTIRPKPSPPGRITYTLTGEAVREQRYRARERLEISKPHTHNAILSSGLSRKEIYERANVGRETLRAALYDSCEEKSASSISEVLAEAADLTQDGQETVKGELLRTPE